MTTWFSIAALVILALLLIIVIVFLRQSSRAALRGDSSPIVKVTLVIAAIRAGISLIGAVVVAVVILIQEQVQITLPVQTFWPALPENTVVEGMSAARLSGGFTHADLLVGGLSTGARVTWALSQMLWWLLPAAIAGMIALACFQLLAGRAFAPVVARVTMITAAVVAAGGITAAVLGDIAGGMASAEVLQYTSAAYTEVEGIEDALQAWWPNATWSITLPFWPIAAGLAFAALAAIFRHGSRLQRDTEGLV